MFVVRGEKLKIDGKVIAKNKDFGEAKQEFIENNKVNEGANVGDEEEGLE